MATLPFFVQKGSTRAPSSDEATSPISMRVRGPPLFLARPDPLLPVINCVYIYGAGQQNLFAPHFLKAIQL